MIDELFNKLLPPRSPAQLVAAQTATGVVVTLRSRNTTLAYGVGDTFEGALLSLDRYVDKVRRGPHVGGE